MKALTIYQPWAYLIALGAKPYEFREWDYGTRYPQIPGQRIVIHAAARPMKYAEIVELHENLKKHGGWGTALNPTLALPVIERLRASMEGRHEHWDLPLSVALCTAIITRARRATDMFKGSSVRDSDRVNQHVWAWPLIELQAAPYPVSCRGAQGFWNFPADLEKELRAGVRP